MSAAEGEPVGSAPGDAVGSAAEEAARLVDALQGWFGARAGTAAGAPTQAVPEDPGTRQHGPACRACPVCRGVAYVRQAHPEVVEHLADAAQHVAAALRALSEPAAHRTAHPTAHPAAHPAAQPSTEAADVRADDPPTDGPHRPTAPAGRAARIDVGPDLPNSGPSEQEPEP